MAELSFCRRNLQALPL